MRAGSRFAVLFSLVVALGGDASGRSSTGGQRVSRQKKATTSVRPKVVRSAAGRPAALLKGAKGKNFRLPESVRPSRYDVELKLDPEGGSFAGQGRIALDLGAATRSITLHSIGHTFGPMSVRVGRRKVAVESIERNPKSETVTLYLAEEVPAGRANLHLSWSGKINQGLRGLYKADDKLVVTQFEAADARRAIPSFDEPSFKATWALTVEAPKGAVVRSNGDILDSKVIGGRRRTRFKTTRKLSSYLVALGAGDLVPSRVNRAGKVAVRTYTTPGKENLTRFAQTVGRTAILRLESYFGRRYPFGKIDQIAVPNFEAGAMENAGMVTYRETALLQDPKTAPKAALKRVAEVIFHEDAHQWFGNLVTMKWWNDLWLNESFATWMSYKQMDGWKPGWRVWLDFNAGRESAFALDALDSTHPIYASVKNAEDAKFDVITYEKGAATLRMIESFVGEKQFRSGIRQYMKRFAYKNATADDLWMAVQDASNQPVMEIANRWIKQKGFPLVEVGLGKSGGVTLRQSRFFSAPGKKGAGVWPVPLIIRYQDDAGVHEERVLFDKRRAELPLGKGKIKWLTANAGSTGFYRVAYQPELMRGLVDNVKSLDAAERIGLLSDTWALVRSGRAGVRDWLDLAEKFAGEKDAEVLGEVTDRFLALDRLISDADRPAFQATVSRMFGPEQARLGWEKPAAAGGGRARETDGVRQRRAALLGLVGKVMRDPAIEAEARRRVQRFLDGDQGALDPELRATAISLAARGGNAALFRAFQGRFQAETDPVLKVRFLQALAGFEDPALSAKAQDMVFAGKVPKQDVFAFVSALLANPAARGPFWQRMQREWPTFSKRLADAPKIRQRVIQAFEQVPGQTGLDEVKALLAKNPPPDAADTIAQTLERMHLAVEFQNRARPDLSTWLAAKSR